MPSTSPTEFFGTDATSWYVLPIAEISTERYDTAKKPPNETQNQNAALNMKKRREGQVALGRKFSKKGFLIRVRLLPKDTPESRSSKRETRLALILDET